MPVLNRKLGLTKQLSKLNLRDFSSDPVAFKEYLDQCYLGLGDVRSLAIDNPLGGDEWYIKEDIPELLTNHCRDPEYLHFVAKYILNVDLLPLQCALQQMMWHKTFPLLIASRGGSKTFNLAVYCALRALLHQGSKIVVVGASLRQSMLIWNYLVAIWERSTILQDIVGAKNRPKRDIHMAYWEVGLSSVIFLPLGQGDKIRGVRACVGPNTLIETNQGLIRIKDSAQYMNDLEIHVGRGVYEQPKYFLQTKPIDAYEITTIGGYNFIYSDIHQIMTTKGWKLGKDLTTNDYLPFENQYQFPTEYLNIDGYDIDESFAFMLGMLISEGSVSSKHTIAIKMTDKLGVDSFSDSLSKIDSTFNVCRYEREARQDVRGWICQPQFEAQLCNLKFRETLVKCGLGRETVLNKKIPDCILRSPRSVVLGFLKGLFWGDGSCYLFKDKRRNNNLGITYYSSSKQLIDEVQILLAKLDLFAGKGSRISKLSSKPNYFIRLYGAKARELYNLLLVDKWKEVYDQCFKDDKSVGNHTALRIKKITKLEGKHILYDYTLPKNQCFIGHGFCQHNTHIICDELASLPSEVFETVVRGFISVKSDGLFENVRHAAKAIAMKELGLDPEDTKQFRQSIAIPTQLSNNQIIMAGTAFYQFNHIHKYYKYYKAIIMSGGDKERIKYEFPEMSIFENIDPSQYAIMRVPYDALPPGMMDDSALEQARATMDSQIYMMEYGACFPADSEGFFLASSINKATCPVMKDGEITKFGCLLRGDKTKRYVMGIDPASESDNFAICIVELNELNGHVVYQWTTNRKKFEELKRDGYIVDTIHDYNTFCIKHIRHLLTRFNIDIICLDAAGGGLTVREGLRDPDKMEKGEYLIQDMDIEGTVEGRKMLKMINFSDTEWRKSSHWGLKADIAQKSIMFPYYDHAEIAVQNVKDVAEGTVYDSLEDNYGEIQQLIVEMTLIKYEQSTSSAVERWDIPKIKGVNAEAIKKTLKKDRFTSLLLANWARRMIIDQSNDRGVQYTKNVYGGVAKELAREQKAEYQNIMLNTGNGSRRICY